MDSLRVDLDPDPVSDDNDHRVEGDDSDTGVSVDVDLKMKAILCDWTNCTPHPNPNGSKRQLLALYDVEEDCISMLYREVKNRGAALATNMVYEFKYWDSEPFIGAWPEAKYFRISGEIMSVELYETPTREEITRRDWRFFTFRRAQRPVREDAIRAGIIEPFRGNTISIMIPPSHVVTT